MKIQKPFTQNNYNKYVIMCCICYIYVYVCAINNNLKQKQMTNFKVQWENIIEAETPLDAANQAYNDICNSQTLGYTVINEETNTEYSVDLSEDEGNETYEVSRENTNSDTMRLKSAFNLLRSVLSIASSENEFDEEIYTFLKENNQLPKDYIPYFED